MYPIIKYSGIRNKPFVLVEDFKIELSNGDTAIIRKGYWTDYASVPRILKLFFDYIGRGNPSYVIHDYMYNFSGYQADPNNPERISRRVDRKFADKEMAYQMRKYGESKLKTFLFYTAVRLAGWRTFGTI